MADSEPVAEQEAAESAVFGPMVEWTLQNPRTKETRTFTQTELMLEGETRLLGLVRRVAHLMRNSGITLEQLQALFAEDATLDWDLAMNLLDIASEQVPEIIAESAVIFCGVYPTDVDGKPDKDYDPTIRFMKQSLNFLRWTDMVRAFAAQNDYRRLARPFSRALAEGRSQMSAPPESGTKTGSPSSTS